MEFLLPYLPILIPVLVILVILLMGYVKAPPDQAYIISGLRKNSRILIGQAGIRIPFLERLDKLYLGQMTVDIKTEQSVPTNDFINVSVDAVAKVRISPEENGIRLAAKNFLNKKGNDIAMDLKDSLQGNMREIIGTLTLEKINTDRDSFSDQVMQKASRDMEKLGIEILSCNIQDVYKRQLHDGALHRLYHGPPKLWAEEILVALLPGVDFDGHLAGQLHAQGAVQLHHFFGRCV